MAGVATVVGVGDPTQVCAMAAASLSEFMAIDLCTHVDAIKNVFTTDAPKFLAHRRRRTNPGLLDASAFL